MRSERALLLAALLLGACDEKKDEAAPSRFEGVKKQAAQDDHFCEKSYAADAKKFVMPPTRPFGDAAKAAGGWKWLNIWATWCTPCVEEMGLLNRWKDAAAHENLPVTFELLSIDEESAKDKLEEWKSKNLPGPISWLRSQDDFGPFLETLGIDKSAAIPIHVLIDPKGNVRCVRVGAIHEQNWGAARKLISGG
ncbi:MAG: TlpA disulfide reductase family protein [Myxococcaceae bacterium]